MEFFDFPCDISLRRSSNCLQPGKEAVHPCVLSTPQAHFATWKASSTVWRPSSGSGHSGANCIELLLFQINFLIYKLLEFFVYVCVHEYLDKLLYIVNIHIFIYIHIILIILYIFINLSKLCAMHISM